MRRLAECSKFNFHVFEDDGNFFIGIHGFGFDENKKCFHVNKFKEFDDMISCMEFVNKFIDCDFEATEEDFLFFATRVVFFDYLKCGVDFDEDETFTYLRGR